MKNRAEVLRSNIWKLNLFQIFKGMFFSVPVIFLFWQDFGLSTFQIMLLQSIFSISIVIFEIPTGYLADFYSRKKMIILMGFSSFLAIFVYSVSSNFWGFLIGEIFFALASALGSGTISAFVYDTLLEIKKERQYKKIWGNMIFLGTVSLAVSGILGGLVASFDLRSTIHLSIPAFLLLLPLAFSLEEPKRKKMLIKENYLKEIFIIIKNVFEVKIWLKWLLVYSGIVFALNQAVFWLYQPYFQFSGLDIFWFGFVFAGFHVFSAFSSKYAYKIENKIPKRFSLISLIFLLALSYFLMWKVVFVLSFLFCFIQQFVRGFRLVVVDDYINSVTSSEIRATVLSIEGFIGKLFYAMILPLIGLIVDIYSLSQALLVLTFVSLSIAGFVLVLFGRIKKNC
jgi:MFS family permease